MLGGAVFSGFDDNSTVYYNAAAMAFVSKPSLSVSINTYRIRFYEMQNANGQGNNLKNTKFATYPNLIAGIFTFDKAKKLRLGYSVQTRTMFTNEFNTYLEKDIDIFPDIPGDEKYLGSYKYFLSIMEYWAGLALSYQFSDRIAVGFSHFGIYRNVKYSNTIDVNAFPVNDFTTSYSSFTSDLDISYWNVKGIFKLSFAYQGERFRVGTSLTFNSFNIIGRGNIYREFSVRNLPESIAVDVSFKDSETKLKSTHKFPGSWASGMSFRVNKKHWIYFSNELFFGTTTYNILDSDKYPSRYPSFLSDELVDQVFDNKNFLDFSTKSVSVWNFGLGLDLSIKDNFSLYLGARTDFLYKSNPYFTFQDAVIESSKWGLYHFSLGGAFITKKGKRITIGTEFSLTPSSPTYSVVNFDNPSAANYMLGEPKLNAIPKQFAFKLILGIRLFDKD